MENATQRERLKRFSKFIVSHAVYSHAVSTLEHAIAATDTSEQPMSAILTGDPGTGKTTVCKYMVSRRPESHVKVEQDGVRRIVPAFYCSVPAEVTIKGLAIVMLDKLGETDLRGDKTILGRRLFALLKTCQTKVIFLDEFHHLLTSDAQKVRASVCDWVKGLMNETGVTVVLVGLPKCEEIIDEHSQLSRRFPYRAYLDRIPYGTGAKSQYLMILKALANAIKEHAGVKEVPPLTDVARASAIYVATGGNMNSLRQLLYDVVRKAVETGRNVIEWADFGEVFGTVHLEFCMVRGRNPFNLPAAEIQKILANGAG